MRQPTIADVARAAGVSVATVDRVLSGRAKVRDETARKVQTAATTIGYHGANAIRQRILAGRPKLRLGLLLQKERHAFYQELKQEFEKQCHRMVDREVRVVTRFATSTRLEELAELLHGFRGHVDAVAATGIDHHEVTAGVAELRQAGIPTFSMLSDFAQGVRESYFGLNNLRVGRTAGWLISKVADRPGKVGIFIGAHRYHGHELRETGMRSYFREYAPEFQLLDGQINLETRDLTYEATSHLLERHDDLVGLYVAGGGMEGAIAAFERYGAFRRCALFVNELTPESHRGLQNRTVSIVFGTPLQQLVAELLLLATSTVDTGPAEMPGQRFFAPVIYTPESLS
ncbi:LacI family DNA-binding transcriptional regulator [Fulvimarina sp. 2208YS6-2-32]|uniref:LacI family DNA-binding transcriptional regulator n=1 Tax=Fulvimarina uroteuthidis TaxID=3098149 RepID=A0ABU5I327_9HYPH|nr:LacI family DNA-binding transcriptional regulator [Fulvimarina sp. 2208YS6-2-32]MDY8109178.1 LacI family DNA-binding transcriptional regulator [Fulvimarina sp. 2208YS6-2-32]